MLSEFILQVNNFIPVVFYYFVALEKTFAHIAIKLPHAILFVFLSKLVVLEISICVVAKVFAINSEASLLRN